MEILWKISFALNMIQKIKSGHKIEILIINSEKGS